VICERLASEAQEAGLRPYGYLAYAAMAAAGLGDREEALRISALLSVVEDYRVMRVQYALYRAMIAGALGDCQDAVELVKEAVQMGRSPVFIHRRYGLMNCRDYPPFQEVAKPRG